jgi:hypothetical protein
MVSHRSQQLRLFVLCILSLLCTTLLPPPTSAAPAPTKDISAGGLHGCALRDDGTVVCWGDDADGQLRVLPGDRYVQVSAGGYHSCALRDEGSIVCWGQSSDGQTTVPPGERFTQVSAGGYHSCALRDEGSIVCWGQSSDGQTTVPPGERFTQVSAGGYHSCALRDDGTIVCWGQSTAGQTTVPIGEMFTQISAGTFHSCALRADGSLACWGHDYHGQTSPPEGRFDQVSAGAFHSCALRADGSLACWGLDYHGQAPQRTLAPAALPDGLGANTYQQRLSLNAERYAVPDASFTVSAGSLPPGLSLSASGELSGTASSAGTSSFSVTATDANGFSATRTYTVTINSAPTTTKILSTVPNVAVVGQPVTIVYDIATPNGSPTGSVSVGDGSASCTASVAASQCALTFRAAGQYTLTATYSGDSTFVGSQSIPLIYQVNAAGPPTRIVALTTTAQSALVGTAFAMPFQAVVTDGYGNRVPGVEVSFHAPNSSASGTFSGGRTEAVTSTDGLGIATAPPFYANNQAGSYSVLAMISGWAAPISFNLTNLLTATTSTTISLSATPNPAPRGQPVTFTATVSSSEQTPSGQVVFKNGASVLDVVALHDGAASFTTASLAPGIHRITATYLPASGGVSGSPEWAQQITAQQITDQFVFLPLIAVQAS